MAENIAVIYGLPTTCNPMKIKLRFEAECKVHIDDIKVDATCAEVKFSSEKDCKIFKENLPKSLKFGNEEHSLVLKEENVSLESSTGKNEYRSLSFFNKIHDWSSLTEFLPSCNRGIVVQPLSSTLSPDDIRKYFEDNQLSCGGSIEAMIAMVDGIFLSFKEETVAEKVWNFRPHRVQGKSVMVYLKIPPPAYQQTLTIKFKASSNPAQHHEEKIALEEELGQLLKECSLKGISANSIKLASSEVFLVLYKSETDFKDVQDIVQEFKNRHPSHSISFLRRTDCLRVESVPEDISDHELRTVFDNEHRTGGGNVTMISRLSESTVIVYFSSYKDAEAVVEKFKGKTLPLFGMCLKIRSYFPILFPETDSNGSAVEEYYRTWLDKKDSVYDPLPSSGHSPSSSGQKYVVYRAVDEDILRFLLQSTEHAQMLNSKLSGVGGGEVSNDGIKIFHDQEDAENRKVAMKLIQQFLTNYAKKNLKVEDGVTRQTIDKKISNHTEQDDICLRWVNAQKKEVIVSGLKMKVDQFFNSVKQSSKNDILGVDEEAMRWLVETKELARLKKDHSAISGHKEMEISFVGGAEEVAAARCAILDVVKIVGRARFITQEGRFVEFLEGAKDNGKIATNVAEFMQKQNLKAILVISSGGPFIVGPEETNDVALTLLNTVLVVDDSLQLDPSDLHTRQQPAWKFAQNLVADGKISLKTKGKTLSVTGFRYYVNEAVKKLGGIVSMGLENIFPIERGAAQYIVDFVHEFTKICGNNFVSFQVLDSGILLKGDKRKVETVVSNLGEWKELINKRTMVIEKAGVNEFFRSNNGKDLLSTAERTYKATVSVIANVKAKLPDNSSATSLSEPLLHTDDCSITIGHLNISIRQGDLTEETNDAIVNSIGPTFDLSRSMLSKAIAAKGGPSIQKELQQHDHLNIRVTSNGKLRCKRIIHANFPSYLHNMGEVFVNVLKEAEKRQSTSISVPAIGTGAGAHDNRAVAKLMLRSFREFGNKHSSSKCLRKVDIVIHDRSQIQDFKEELLLADLAAVGAARQGTSNGKYSAGSLPSPRLGSQNEARGQQSANIGNLLVSVRHGDITDETNDAIVNSTGPYFDLTYGMVSKAILKKGGQEIQKDVRSRQDKWIRVTGAGKLNCSKIIHAVAPDSPSVIRDCLVGILRTAERESCKSLSVPAIGTGNRGFSVADVATIMLKSIREFACDNPTLKHLRRVDFVIFHRQQEREFRNAFFRGIPIQAESDVRSESVTVVDRIEIEVFSADKDSAVKALEFVEKKVNEALGHIIHHTMIDKMTEKEGKYLKDCESNFGVEIIRSRTQLTIKGSEENASKAQKAVLGMLEDFGLSTLTSYFVWEYNDNMGNWYLYPPDYCQKLEALYPKFLKNIAGSRVVQVGSGSAWQMIDFEKMLSGTDTAIRRTLMNSDRQTSGEPSSLSQGGKDGSGASSRRSGDSTGSSSFSA